ncbi:hypothetical protein pipiens_007564 [Culex pipiens pipiens]|uniref:Uncharacterized protein n=1 Tax=Culex pipiens pipiens TaxID=38569 RepID=A0ABD1DPI0_CULPP
MKAFLAVALCACLMARAASTVAARSGRPDAANTQLSSVISAGTGASTTLINQLTAATSNLNTVASSLTTQVNALLTQLSGVLTGLLGTVTGTLGGLPTLLTGLLG